MSLRRLALRYCDSVPVTSLASLGRLSTLENLALVCVFKDTGVNNTLQLLAGQLPAGLTSLDFRACTTSNVSGPV